MRQTLRILYEWMSTQAIGFYTKNCITYLKIHGVNGLSNYEQKGILFKCVCLNRQGLSAAGNSPPSICTFLHSKYAFILTLFKVLSFLKSPGTADLQHAHYTVGSRTKPQNFYNFDSQQLNAEILFQHDFKSMNIRWIKKSFSHIFIYGIIYFHEYENNKIKTPSIRPLGYNKTALNLMI